MRIRDLDQLVSAGLIRPKAPDPERVARWLVQADRDLDLAERVLWRLSRPEAG